ncbi:MAG: carboxypeptidase-like regulatory domain-containing protein [Cyanobacteria bacterium NC_groundwater_1444_Ag_S-0.65um_54_12]|nr:carboxypeptidase-like regulatory domain-containing protein [Cyanobacteria bacterium NC_groundwater_1444_Ag_S-0.65um_54_12]
MSKASWVYLLILFLLFGCGGRANMAASDGGFKEGKEGQVEIRVKIAEQPAAGALVQLLDSSKIPLSEQKADVQGLALFEHVPTGDGYSAIAMLEGVAGRVSNLRVSGGKVTAQLLLATGNGPTGIIMGSIKLAGADRPLPGAMVEANGTKTQADANGQFKLEGIAAGTVLLKANMSGYVPVKQTLLVKAATSNMVSLLLSPLASGPKAGHTIVTTPTQVQELDAWGNSVANYPGSELWSAVFLPAGGMLVAEAGADRVQEYGSTGSKGKSYTGRALWQLGIGGVEAPRGASRTQQGNIMVADTGHDRILELTDSNKITWEYEANLSEPRWAERLPNGNVLIVDTGNHRVIEVKNAGTIVWGFGAGGTDLLNHPSCAQRLPNGNTLICDAGNDRVLEVNNQGALAWLFPAAERNKDVNLANPNSAKRLPSGNTLIADTDNNRVMEIDAAGNLTWRANIQQPLFADRF